jgi:acyl-CoA thioesterase
MENNTEFFDSDAFARHTGIVLLEVSTGRAKVKMEICDTHRNSHQTVHGGAIFTLADTAFAIASNSHGVPAAAINASIWYVKATAFGTLYAEAEEVSLTPRLATYAITVTDQDGEKIALFQGMVYRKGQRREARHE